MKVLCLYFCLLIPTILFAETPIINYVGVTPGAEEYQVRIKTTGKPVYSTFMMNDPPRVVLDFENTKTALKRGTFEPKQNLFVSRLRLEDHEASGKKSFRIAVELKSADIRYATNPTTDGLVLQIRSKENTSITDSSKKITTIPPPVQNPFESSVVIGSEDLIEIHVFELPQFDVTSRVAADGTITMPLAGSVEIRGLTKKQAEAKIATALEAKYINSANVSVEIKEYKSKQVSVFGAVNHPGPYYILSNRTLIQLLSEAGGLTPDAGKKGFIFRSGSSDKTEINLEDLLNNGNPKQNVPIFPGDVINIPKETKVVVYVLGEVKTPGAIEIDSSLPLTLLSAIARAGGVTSDANQSNIQIRRKDGKGSATQVKANLKNIIKGKAADVPLFAGDIVNVPKSFF